MAPASGWSANTAPASLRLAQAAPGASCTWRKLHLGVDAGSGEILAVELTSHEADDGAQVGPLLDQVAGPVASFTGDGAYDREDVYGAVAARHPEAEVIVPPRSNAVPSDTAATTPTPRGSNHLKGNGFSGFLPNPPSEITARKS